MQLSFIDELEKTTSQAIDASGIYAQPDWYQAAEQAVAKLARQYSEFTTDDVWRLLRYSGLTTPEPRAMGSVMRGMARAGLIVATDRTVKSLRRECHRRPLTVWRALA